MTTVFIPDVGGSLLTSLVAYYKMANINDYYAANHLTNFGVTPFQAGKFDTAVKFDGTTQYLRRAAPLSVQTANVSIFMWVYVGSASEMGCFVHNGADHATAPTGYSLGVGGTSFYNVGNKLIGQIDTNPAVTLPFDISIGTGWHFVGITRGASEWKGYVDNVVGPGVFANTPPTPTSDFIVGAGNPVNPVGGLTVNKALWNNKIDELAFWNKELSSQERSDLYNGGIGQTLLDVVNMGMWFAPVQQPWLVVDQMMGY